MHQTFKQFYESRLQLIEQIRENPTAILRYTAKKYSNIQLNCNGATKYIAIKPTQELLIEWSYEDINHPSPVNCKIISRFGDSEEGVPVMESNLLQQWLLQNTDSVNFNEITS